MSDTPFLPLASETDWADALSQSDDRPVLIFKHSNRCPLSASANREMHALAAEEDLPVYRVVVQEHRVVSDDIADTLDIRHETPQAILLDDGDPVFDASHHDVTADAIREVVRSETVSR